MKLAIKVLPIITAIICGVLFFAYSEKKVDESVETLDQRSEKLRSEKLRPACDALKPLHAKRGQMQPGDWLQEHEEAGQSVLRYTRSKPNRPDSKKKFIYIQLIGTFTESQLKVLDLTIEYMQESFGLPVKKLASYSIDKIPEDAQRKHPVWKNHQLYTRHLMDKVLLPNRPADAVALIGFTGVDLYPDPDWNFVFGIASLRNRIGLWSIYRNGDPAVNEDTFKICLKRTIGTAIHETGHIFGIQHCIAYECIMAVCNSQEESDRRDLYYCPSCLQKLVWNTGVKPAERFKRMVALCEKLEFEKEKKFFEKSLQTLEEKKLLDSH
ncbi:MAG: archaemetzincin [Lentisphaeraceae bacterium]|nr:archaemetzincin [Lentisphaeraceae bacterium]